MLKRWLAAVTVAAMVAGLTACGSGSGSESASGGDPAAQESEGAQGGEDGAASEESESADYKIGLMISPLASREEYYRTAEMLIEEYGADKFVMDVYPENPQNEQEVTISKSLNIAMDPDVKAMIFDSADIGTIAAVNKIREERPELKILFGSLNEDVYEMAEVADLMLSIDPDLYGESVAQMAVDAGAEHFIFYSFARHMSNSLKVRHLEAMKSVCEANGVAFEQVTMPDPMGDAGVSGAQQFLIENIPALMDQYGTKNIAYFATVSTIQESMLKTIVENGGIYPCHTDPSPFSAFSGALGLEIDDAHKYDAEYVTNLITETLTEYGENGRVGGWEVSMIRCEMEFLFQYAMAYCEGRTNEVDGAPDKEMVKQLLIECYGDSAQVKNYVNEETGEEYDNWFTVGRDVYVF